ncbi:8-oxoguanine deaminase [Segniliparus rugosus]|uniref:Amidohydrolase-related domain-containing protein n=1 Tax=Segniliparus rugosus (strain ATCC BAA-974 / DSM 45345 / CCUG 50838 / CIP 108380 / JCM 13579 / CDC 945) TaxID=679197 RepID=E5XPZ1_SEGRC|nr:8-oxoguanine deaminase [Segniliparus rugosus]EFV13586.1 hypothetical protein HMPREF9336_01563 [Segniliparus rugosus ATCC BAA-974]
MTADLLVRNAYVVVDHEREIPSGWVAVEGGRVAAVGPAGAEPPADTTIDARERVVTAGLVNTHHHMYQNLTRAYGPATGGSLFEWLTTLYPIWAGLDSEAVYLSTYVAMAELLRGGCTTSMDHMYVHPKPGLIDAQARAARDVGFRFFGTRGSMTRSVEDGGLPPKSVTQDADEILADCERVVGAFHDPKPGAMTRIGLAPCSPFSVTERLMAETAELAERLDVRLHTHLAEDHDEHEYCQRTYGATPVEYFERVGWATGRSWVAHFIYPSEAEARRLAAKGVSAAHCPSSNMILANGTLDSAKLRAMGMPVGLGCDGSSSADSASLWLEARTALLLAKFRGGPGAMGAREALDMATRGGAQCLGWEDEIGHLRPGACADLVVWHADELSVAGGWSDPVETLLRCGPHQAATTIVAGKVLVHEGRFLGERLGDVLAAHREVSKALQRSAAR